MNILLNGQGSAVFASAQDLWFKFNWEIPAQGSPIVDKCTQIFDEHELVSTNKLHHLNAQLWLAATDHVMSFCPVIGQWSSDTNYELCPADKVMIFN